MGYTSFFAGGNNVSTKAQPTSGGGNTGADGKGGYSSYFGYDVPKAPSTQQLQQIRQQQAAKAMQNQVQAKAAPQHQTLLNRLQGAVADIGKAGRAVARPAIDVVGGTASAVNNEIHNKPVTTAALGKAAHDTAQLTSDVSGGTVNQFAKGIAQAPGAIAGEIASQSKDPFVRAQGVQAVQGAQKKAYGTTDSGTIAKKIAASTVGTGSMFVGGGEVAGAKALLSKGAVVAGKQVAKDAAIGAAGNASATVTQNPNATAKDIGKSAAVGGLLGAVAPHAIKGAGDAGRYVANKTGIADNPVANTLLGSVKQGQNDLLNVKTNALLTKAQNLETPQTSASHVAVTPHVSYEPTNPRVKTLVDSAQKQQQAVEAPMKAAQAEQDKAAAQAEKAQADGQKVDRQIELLQAKAKDSETGLSNVDKTKLQHLQEDKAQVGATAPVEPVAKPVNESPNAAAPATAPKAAKAVSSKASVAPENPHAGIPLHEVAKQVDASPADRQVLQTVADQVEKQGGLKGGYYETAKRMGLGEQWQEASGNVSRASTKAYQKANPEYSGVLPGGKPAKVEAPSTNTKTNETPQTKEPVAAQPTAVHQESLTEQPASKVSGSALKSEQKAVESGLVKSLGDKAQYDTGSYKVEAANAVKLAHDNPEEAKAIAMGQKPGNNTIHEVAVRHAVEQQAIKEKDVQTLLDLSKSTQHTATSEAAQRLGTEGYHADSTSPVAKIREVSQIRQDAFKAKTGKTANVATQKEIQAIRAATPKSTVTKETWGSFIDSLKC